jgi:Flp pilus assembly protein TadG
MRINMLPIRKLLLSKQGQSLVEVALVIPALLILFLGIAELGFYLYTHVQIANATREGARRGSLCRLNNYCLGTALPDAVTEAVKVEAQALKIVPGTNTQVTVQPSSLSGPPATGSPITVTVVYDYTSPFVSNFVPMFPAQIPIRHTVVMHFDK